VPDNGVFDDYEELIRTVDERCSELTAIHGAHLLCRRGCCECCGDIAVQPLEIHAIRSKLPGLTGVHRDTDTRCIFLHEGACSIYGIRPVICRVHGLPLLYPVEEWGAKSSETKLTWCELNFTDGDPEPADGLIDMREINATLFRLNDRFLSEPLGAEYRATGWIHLSSLRE
jgi:hypothetical protein